MAVIDLNVLVATSGYLVADSRGRIVGRVEAAAGPKENGAPPRLTIRGRLPFRRRLVALATEVDDVDTASQVVALSVERSALRRMP